MVAHPSQGKLVFPIQDHVILRATVPRGKGAPPSGTAQGGSGGSAGTGAQAGSGAQKGSGSGK
jgi:hypothetical protein